jgi:hypothetical protein
MSVQLKFIVLTINTIINDKPVDCLKLDAVVRQRGRDKEHERGISQDSEDLVVKGVAAETSVPYSAAAGGITKQLGIEGVIRGVARGVTRGVTEGVIARDAVAQGVVEGTAVRGAAETLARLEVYEGQHEGGLVARLRQRRDNLAFDEKTVRLSDYTEARKGENNEYQEAS